jgi:hypothetical protein
VHVPLIVAGPGIAERSRDPTSLERSRGSDADAAKADGVMDRATGTGAPLPSTPPGPAGGDGVDERGAAQVSLRGSVPAVYARPQSGELGELDDHPARRLPGGEALPLGRGTGGGPEKAGQRHERGGEEPGPPGPSPGRRLRRRGPGAARDARGLPPHEAPQGDGRRMAAFPGRSAPPVQRADRRGAELAGEAQARALVAGGPLPGARREPRAALLLARPQRRPRCPGRARPRLLGRRPARRGLPGRAPALPARPGRARGRHLRALAAGLDRGRCRCPPQHGRAHAGGRAGARAGAHEGRAGHRGVGRPGRLHRDARRRDHPLPYGRAAGSERAAQRPEHQRLRTRPLARGPAHPKQPGRGRARGDRTAPGADPRVAPTGGHDGHRGLPPLLPPGGAAPQQGGPARASGAQERSGPPPRRAAAGPATLVRALPAPGPRRPDPHGAHRGRLDHPRAQGRGHLAHGRRRAHGADRRPRPGGPHLSAHRREPALAQALGLLPGRQGRPRVPDRHGARPRTGGLRRDPPGLVDGDRQRAPPRRPRPRTRSSTTC